MNSKQPAREALRRLSLLSISNLFTSPKSSVAHRRISSAASAGKTARKAGKEPSPPRPTTRDSAILEKFNLRRIKGAVKERPNAKIQSQFNCAEESGIGEDKKRDAEKMMVWGFEGLGLGKEEMREVMEVMGVFVPSEIQSVGIPAILEGKNLVLSSPCGSGRTLAYLFPLLQLLKRDRMVKGMKSEHLQAIVICATEELADEVFQDAKFINDRVKVTSKPENDIEALGREENSSSSQLGMLVATPSEILQHIEEGLVVVDNVKFLVIDDADMVLSHGRGSEICKIMSSFRIHLSKSCNGVLQTILVTSELAKMLGESYMEHFERDHAGKVTAMFLELDQEETFELMKSLEALRKKMQEAMDSLPSASSVLSSSLC